MTTTLPIGTAVGPRLDLLAARVDLLAAELAAARRRTDELEARLAALLADTAPIPSAPDHPEEG